MRPRHLLLALALLPLSTTAAALLAACDDDGAADGTATSGKRVSLKTRLAADTAPFTNGLGYKVTLSKAAVATGPLYYFDGAPPFASLPARRRSPLAWLGPRLAWAHPGHYVPGNAKGQVLSPSSADLFAGTADLPDGEGVSGVVRSAQFSFSSPPTGPAAAALGQAAAMAEGVAEKDGTSIHFSIRADLAAISTHAAEGKISGCVLEEVDVQGDGTVTLTVRPSVWFNLVDFSKVAPGSSDAPTVISPADDAHLGFVVGLAQLSAYRFKYTP